MVNENQTPRIHAFHDLSITGHGAFHLRALMRLTGLPSASIQTELRRMAKMGALRREEEGTRVF